MIKLPTTVRKASRTSPSTLLLYSAHKRGKTTILTALTTQFAKEGKGLVVEFEPGGADFNDGVVLQINNVPELLEFIAAVKAADYPYDYIAFDTLTKLDEWSEYAGTFKYMDKPQGKKHNVVDGVRIRNSKHPNFETVHEIPNGFGYRYSREVMIDWYEQLRALAPHTIFTAHTKDTKVETKSGDVVDSQDISLTGRVKSILSTRVDAVGRLIVEGDDRYISFNANSKAEGGRCPHLEGNILISSKNEDNTITTYWQNIYINEINK
tara:strand:- start:308 stop:1105 length:798 start_codon:yes stop_codon:yes gene_type:complete